MMTFLGDEELLIQGLDREKTRAVIGKAMDSGQISTAEIASIVPANIHTRPGGMAKLMSWVTSVLNHLGIVIGISKLAVRKPISPRDPKTEASFLLDSRVHPVKPAHKPASKPETRQAEDEEPDEGETEQEFEEPELDSEEELEPDFVHNGSNEPLRRFFVDIKQYPLLPHATVVALAEKFVRTGDLEIRNKIVCHNLRLAANIAFRNRGRGLDVEDMVQEGALGLVIAAERYDPSLGFHFSTYATWWVRQKISRAIHDQALVIRIPVHIHEKRKKFNDAVRDLTIALRREPTIEEIAAETGESVKATKNVLASFKLDALSLETVLNPQSWSSSDALTLGETLSDDSSLAPDSGMDAFELFEQKVRMFKDFIKYLHMSSLPPRSIEAFLMYYGLHDRDANAEHTLESVAECLDGVTRERVRQRIASVWQSLKDDEMAWTEDALLLELEHLATLEGLLGRKAHLPKL